MKIDIDWVTIYNDSQHQRGIRCAEDLIGTCSSIENEAEEGDNTDDTNFLAGLDETAFECAECGWWCEIGEAKEGPNGEDVCGDHSDEED